MKRFFTSKIYIFVFFAFFNSQQAFSFENPTITDTRALSMGDLHALSLEFSNPASLPFHPRIKTSAIFYNRFQMKELNTSGLRTVFPNRFIATGFQLSHFGYQDYYYSSLQTGLGKQINDHFSIGARIDLAYLNNFLNEKSQTGLKAGLGSLFQLSSSTRICLLAENIVSTFNEKNYSIHLGIAYQCLPILNISSEISYLAEKQINTSFGIEYQIIDELFFRAGFRTYFTTPSLGAAYKYKNIDVGIAFTTHRLLGNSSMIDVCYRF